MLCWRCFAGLLVWTWRSDGSLVSPGHVPTDEQLQLRLHHLITSLKQLYLWGSNSAWILLECQPDLSVCWNVSSNYPICINPHRLPEIPRGFPASLPNCYSVVLFAAIVPHEPFHSSAEAVFDYSWYHAWCSSLDQNQRLSKIALVLLRVLIPSSR